MEGLRKLSKTIFVFIFLPLCGLSGTLSAEQRTTPPAHVLYFEPLLYPSSKDQQTEDGQRLEVSFTAFGRQFELLLEPNDLFVPGAEIIWVGNGTIRRETPTNVFYKGRVKTEPGSWIRVSWQDGTLDGLIWTKDELYFVESGKQFFAGPSPFGMVIYRLSDTVPDWDAGRCALDEPGVAFEMMRNANNDPLSYDALMSDFQTMSSEAPKEVELAVTADYEYFTLYGTAGGTRIQSIINAVDGVYQSTSGMTLRIAKTVIHETSNDPFSNTTDPVRLVNELSNYYNTNNDAPTDLFYGADLLHLFTGRDLSGSTIGIAYVGVVCNQSVGVGLSQDIADSTYRTILTAHEIGHNFDADHDGQFDSACASTPPGFIMSPAVNQVTHMDFSQCSKDFIFPHRDDASCLATVANTDSDTPGLINPTTSTFYLRNTNSSGVADISFKYGSGGTGWTSLSGDWNSDGIDTPGLFNPAASIFYLRNTNTAGVADVTFKYGSSGAGWTPLVGDWNRDGRDTIGLFNPATSTFYLRNANTAGVADLAFKYGSGGAGWLPLSGDWDGDGTDTVGLFDPATSTFYLRNSNTAGVADVAFKYGSGGAGWLPLVGDWDDDGIDTAGLYDPTTSTFYLRNANTAGVADVTFKYGSGGVGWLPLVGNWDGE